MEDLDDSYHSNWRMMETSGTLEEDHQMSGPREVLGCSIKRCVSFLHMLNRLEHRHVPLFFGVQIPARHNCFL